LLRILINRTFGIFINPIVRRKVLAKHHRHEGRVLRRPWTVRLAR
jgi:hypothetical protein